MRQNRSGQVDLGAYFAAIGLFARNPVIITAPFAAGLAGVIIKMLLPENANDPIGLTGLLVLIVNSFGLGVALIIADTAWRRGRASFDDGWTEAKRKAGDIIFAAIGVNFVVFIGQYAGQMLGSGIVSIVLSLAAYYFFIYTLPAAAIGGIPGIAALQVSIERVQSSYVATAILFVVCGTLYLGLPALAGIALGVTQIAGLSSSTAILDIVVALVQAVVIGYVALVLAKHYNDVSYRRY